MLVEKDAGDLEFRGDVDVAKRSGCRISYLDVATISLVDMDMCLV